jgi:hypothetical protein
MSKLIHVDRYFEYRDEENPHTCSYYLFLLYFIRSKLLNRAELKIILSLSKQNTIVTKSLKKSSVSRI